MRRSELVSNGLPPMSAPDKSDGPRRRAFPWKRLWFPLGAVGLFAVIGAAYYTLQVTSQQRYFTERAFRILAFQDGTLSNGADGIRSVFYSSSFLPRAAGWLTGCTSSPPRSIWKTISQALAW